MIFSHARFMLFFVILFTLPETSTNGWPNSGIMSTLEFSLKELLQIVHPNRHQTTNCKLLRSKGQWFYIQTPKMIPYQS